VTSFTQQKRRDMTWRMVYRMFFLGLKICARFFCTPKTYKNLLKT